MVCIKEPSQINQKKEVRVFEFPGLSSCYKRIKLGNFSEDILMWEIWSKIKWVHVSSLMRMHWIIAEYWDYLHTAKAMAMICIYGMRSGWKAYPLFSIVINQRVTYRAC